MADFLISADWRPVAVSRWVQAPLSLSGYVSSTDWRAVAVPRWFQATLPWSDATSLLGIVNRRASTVAKRFTAVLDWSDATSVIGACHYDVGALLYKMRGMDAVVDGLYETWLAGSSDLRAQSYAGALALPLRDVCVIDVWNTAAAAAPSTKGIVMPDTLIVLRLLLTGTVPQQLTTTPTPVKTTSFIKASATNTAPIALVVNGSGTFVSGLQLAPGDPAVAEIDDLSKLWFVTTDPGQSVAVTASQ
jgi:hypothetical protein